MRIPLKRLSIITIALCAFLAFLAFLAFPALSVAADQAGKWERIVLDLPNSSYSGNPFEIPVEAQFTHAGTGTQLTLPAYYAGNDTWKIGFMPTLTGSWTYRVVSSNAQLDGLTGSVDCVESGRPGLLAADPNHPRKWKFADGDYVVPIALRLEFFFEDFSTTAWESAVDFLVDDVKGHIYDTRLQDEFSSTMDVFDGNPSNLQFDLAKWDRMEQRMNALAERNAGAYIMFYADDTGEPDWGGKSTTEALLIRYAVARLAGFAVVLWDTGIDIAEYRSQSDINWFGEQIRAADPYGHPVSSRIGGGSGSHYMSDRTYDSQGDRRAIIDDMIGYFEETSRPVAMADSWGENYSSQPTKDFTPADVRRAIWKSVMAGGMAAFFRGDDGYFHVNSVRSDLESEQWLRLVNPFIRDKLGATFGEMVPASSLASNATALADPGRSLLLFHAMGENDSWDSGNGGDITVALGGLTGNYTATWFDPRTGAETSAGVLAGGSSHTLSPPTQDDWVVLLSGSGAAPNPAPRAPTNLQAD